MATDSRKIPTRGTSMKKFTMALAALVLFSVPVMAQAKPQVSVTITAEKEVTTVKNGQKVTKKVAAKHINPGDVILYTLNYANAGDEEATNVVLDDPLPLGTVYLPGSAFGEHAELLFSIDGGKNFKKPTLLTYDVKKKDGSSEKRTASPEEYTTIRWVISKIAAGAKGTAGFLVRIKQ